MDTYRLRQLVLEQFAPEDASAGAMDSCGLEELLSYLIQFENVLRRLAEYPNLSPVVLEVLSQDEHLHVKMAAARNPNTPPAALVLLEQSPARAALALNPATPAHILRNLSRDGDLDIRRGLAANPACPAEILLKLGQDQEFSVLKALAENPNAPLELLEDLAQRGEVGLHRALAHNPNLSPEVFAKLLQSPDPVVQNLLSRHPASHTTACKASRPEQDINPVSVPPTPLQSRPPIRVTRPHRHPH